MHGMVVQAIQGQRNRYLPLQSQLTASHQLIDVVAAILQVYPFDCVYIADLNAIMRDAVVPDHRALIAHAMQAFPEMTWWIDPGVSKASEALAWQALGVKLVLASEAQTSLADYQALQDTLTSPVLSLDYFADGFHGPAALDTSPKHWTQPTILMSLPQVGAQRGPNLPLIKQKLYQRPEHTFYAAGGVRHLEDIEALQQHGAKGVLIASALHHGGLNSQSLAAIAQKKTGD